MDGGEAEGGVRRLRGAFVSPVPGAAVLGAGEGRRHRPAGAAAGGAGKTYTHQEFHQSNRCSTSGGFFQVEKNVEREKRHAICLHTHTRPHKQHKLSPGFELQNSYLKILICEPLFF